MKKEMNIQDDYTQENPLKKRKTFTIERRVVFGWWMFLIAVAGWMFFIGIIVGRESAPVYFDVPVIDFDLMASVSSVINPDNADVVMPESPESHDLEFFEALKDSKNSSKKIAEIDQDLKSRPKPVPPVPAPSEGKKSTEEAKSEKSGEAVAEVKGKSNASSEKGVAKADKTEASKKDPAKKDTVKDQKTASAKKEKTPDLSAEKNLKKPAEAKKTKQAEENIKKTSAEKSKELKKQNGESQATKKDSFESKNIRSESGAEKKIDSSGKSLEEKIEKKPAEKKDTPKSGRYTIQAGAYKTGKDAEDAVKKLGAAGYSASVIKGKSGDGTEWFRIRIGSYPERDKAIKMAETIKKAGFPVMVINIPQE